MNNSHIAIDKVNLSLENEKTLKRETLNAQEAELVRLIEAIDRLIQSEDWSTLKKLRFDKHLDSLERQLKSESEKTPLDSHVIYKLQGELKWARKWSDLSKLALDYRTELTNIRKLIKQYE